MSSLNKELDRKPNENIKCQKNHLGMKLKRKKFKNSKVRISRYLMIVKRELSLILIIKGVLSCMISR